VVKKGYNNLYMKKQIEIRNKRVLVIDDDVGIQEAIKAVLEFGEYEVYIASEESEALKSAKQQMPGLILLDLLLSGKDGTQVLKKLKQVKETENIPIIMLSAHPDAEKASKDSGAQGFIAKPFDMNDLLEKVKEYI